MITGLFGGMGGCAMIGQSVINVKSGANSRLSTFTAGIVLIFMIIVLGGLVVQVPMPILQVLWLWFLLVHLIGIPLNILRKHQKRMQSLCLLQ